MKKDKSIIKLIENLKGVIDFTHLEIVDHWEADLCAIGLRRKNKLVYISTFNYVGSKAITYDFDMEIINENKEQRLEIVQSGQNVSETELINEVRVFLNV